MCIDLEGVAGKPRDCKGGGCGNDADLGVQLDFAPERRVPGLLDVPHEPRGLRLEAPRVVIHILAEQPMLSLKAQESSFTDSDRLVKPLVKAQVLYVKTEKTPLHTHVCQGMLVQAP